MKLKRVKTERAFPFGPKREVVSFVDIDTDEKKYPGLFMEKVEHGVLVSCDATSVVLPYGNIDYLLEIPEPKKAEKKK